MAPIDPFEKDLKPRKKTGPSLLEDSKTSHHKRKRDDAPAEELEIDVSLPEPPSKKELRRAKKAKLRAETVDVSEAPGVEDTQEPESKKRSEHGIWIGNLPWTATKDYLRQFIIAQTAFREEQITRIHMPVPKNAAESRQTIKPKNKGFAYVDFSTPEAVDVAIAVSDTLMGGRRVLIKNAKSFEGRPPPSGDAIGAAAAGAHSKPPNKRVFVGNLGFETTKEDLEQLYSHCGEVAHIHMATFEDSGKCKGFAWVTFADLDSATDAVKGWTFIPVDESEDEEDGLGGDMKSDEEIEDVHHVTKAKKRRKWFVNRLRGRALRCEFAEDPTSRYTKRFGQKRGIKDSGQDGNDDSIQSATVPVNGEADSLVADGKPANTLAGHTGSRTKLERSSDKHSFRKSASTSFKPTLAAAPPRKHTGAIVDGQGKRTIFE